MKTIENKFKGVGVALITPFTSEGNIDFNALRGLIDWHLRSKVDFFCILDRTKPHKFN